MRQHQVTCPTCGRYFLSVCDDDTGWAVDPCPTCQRTAADYWSPDDNWPNDELEDEDIF